VSALQTFTIKQLRFTFTLANNAKFNGTNNQLVIAGLRASVSIKGSGLPAFPEAEISIYGMLQSDMIALTALAFQPSPAMMRNTVVIEANGGGGWSTVFSGQIITGGPNYDNLPNVFYGAQCRVLGYESLAPADAISYTGATDVGLIMARLAANAGFVFQNNGVNQTLDSPYLDKTLAEQIRKVKHDAGIEVYIDGNLMTIAPNGTPRADVPSFTLTPKSGLRGYPKLDYQRGFVNASAFFNPGFRFGGPITIQDSDVITANGNWLVGTITHNLESLMPNGAWFSELLLYPPTTGAGGLPTIPPTS
jgi:hypothetical protein